MAIKLTVSDKKKLVDIIASAETIKIDPIVNFTKEPGHFNDVGKWVKDVVSTPPTNREKIFHELTEGIAS